MHGVWVLSGANGNWQLAVSESKTHDDLCFPAHTQPFVILRGRFCLLDPKNPHVADRLEDPLLARAALATALPILVPGLPTWDSSTQSRPSSFFASSL